VAEEEVAPSAEESAPAPQEELEVPTAKATLPEAPTAEATLLEASIIEGKCSAEVGIPSRVVIVARYD
jgi:hypothetical protein